MAGSAEAVALPFARPGFRPPLEIVATGEAPVEIPAIEWRDADSVAGLRLVREAAKEEAAQVLQDRVDQLCEDPETLAVPNPVDPLTTAARALEVKKKFGVDSPEYAEARASLVHDCKRLFAEAYRKRRWEHFAETKQTHNPVTGDYEFMGYSLTTMTRQGITPLAEKGEQVNRGIEFVEEATGRAVRTLGHLAVGNLVVLRPGQAKTAEVQAPEARMMTISECPDWAIDAYRRKSKGGWGGYAPEVEKMMLRGVRFANDGNRYQEQLGLPGMFITHDVVVEALQEMQLAKPGQEPSKEDVRAMQLMNLTGQDVFDVAKILDAIASRHSGKTIFLGEEVAADHPRDYASAREEAAARQERQQGDAENMADFLMDLEARGVDHWPAQGLVERKVHKMIFRGVKGDPEAAAAAFDDKTAERIAEAKRRREEGDEEGARKIEIQAEKEAPEPSFCGAGSCGIEQASIQEAAEACSALGIEGDFEVLRDSERPCQNCKTVGEVFYVVDKDSGDLIGKYCSNCKATEGGNNSADEPDSK